MVWPVLAILAVCAALLGATGRNPFEVAWIWLRGSLFDEYGLANTALKMSPLLLSGLAVVVPLRVGVYNIGGEGQMYLGGLTASLVAFHLPTENPWVMLVACSLGGALGGAGWALIAALLKAYRGVSEVLVTLLMNYVALNLVNYVVSGPLLEPEAPYPYSALVPPAARLPRLSEQYDLHIGLAVGIAILLACAIVFRYTRLGYSLRLVGDNPKVAAYSGVPVRTAMIGAFVFGGALAGLAGAYEVLGVKYRLYHHFVSGYGTDGIVVAFLACGNPIGVLFSAFFVAALKGGATALQRNSGVPVAVAEVVEAALVIAVALVVIQRRRRIQSSPPAAAHE